MRVDAAPGPGRIRRLREELVEEGFPFATHWSSLLLAEVAYALRPVAHERRVPSVGAFVAPSVEFADWDARTGLRTTVRCIDELSIPDARRFADGLSSWLVRPEVGGAELAVFDRPAGSERDLVVLAEATGATVVQRHPAGAVRAVGAFGVLRWDGVRWHHEPPTAEWIGPACARQGRGDPAVRALLIEFAIHDLGARGTGALLVYRPDDTLAPAHEPRLATPPPLDIRRPEELAPLRHVLAQIDGAAFFDRDGVLRQIGVRLVPSREAESDVEGFRGMRHTVGRRYSFDDPSATVIVVSEDGPVTVLCGGRILGRTEGD
jgi:hypothetical protein